MYIHCSSMQMASLAEKAIKFCCRASEEGLPVTGNMGTHFFSELEHALSARELSNCPERPVTKP